MLKRGLSVAATVIALFAATRSFAVQLVPGADWTYFTFGDVGSSFSDTFTFDLTQPTLLRVTDAFLSGDQFEIFINGVSQGLTSAPTVVGDQTTDYELAYADPRWSSGGYLLGAGSYTVSGTVAASPYDSGGAAIMLGSAVPEIATWLMMMAGIGAAGAMLRARRRPQNLTLRWS